MSARNLESRVVKLEAVRKRPDEILLVWRRPDGDVSKATSVARFSPGDRVICAEWFGEGPLPEPRWYRDRLSSALDDSGKENLNRTIERIADRERDPALVGVAHIPSRRLAEMSDNELLHAALGVAT